MSEEHALSRRGVLRGGAVAGAAVAAGALGVPAAASAHEHYKEGSLRGDLLLHNGRIHTMDAQHRVVSVLAIQDGRIVYAGANEGAARRLWEGKAPAVDLRGRTAIPGLIDCHNHVVLMGNRPGYHTPLENAYSVADVQRTYRERARHTPRGKFVTTIGGFHFNQFQQVRLPTLAELDAAVPDHPAYLSIGFTGPSVTNTLGKKFFEAVSPAVTVGADGSIAGGQETGKATLALRRALTDDDRRRSALDAMAYAVSLGVTTHLDQGAFQKTDSPSDGAAHEDNYSMNLPFLQLFDEGKATIRLRINFLHQDTDANVTTLTQRIQNTFKFFGNDMVRTGAIGEFIAASYFGGPVFLEAARRTAKARWRVEVHSLTGTDFQTQIQAFEAVDAEIGIKDLRWVIAHVPRISAEYLDRLKAVGGGVNLTGYQYLAGTGPTSGPPFRTIVDHGIPAGMSSDGMQIAPMNPWIHAYYATTGRNALGNQINAGQQISRQELLHLYTRANQWFLGGDDEDQLGALEVGRLGDVVVLSDDYFTVPDDKLRNLRSVLTVVGGAVVHDTGDVR
ncbi:amidohydrolase family protein [Dactylosporangium sp. AC04546]|uniref:amidohydrolase n=1 Tax=Dactylosporangium sp. AC04546 TaxID=2862460 RepID=UPI001EE02800|nr:amidohydrolase family protein [Dactylosporangium sp. AC04546]WVK81512.1 amidohydrolase family protein [Dactylosporangium sp. AC04546]